MKMGDVVVLLAVAAILFWPLIANGDWKKLIQGKTNELGQSTTSSFARGSRPLSTIIPEPSPAGQWTTIATVGLVLTMASIHGFGLPLTWRILAGLILCAGLTAVALWIPAARAVGSFWPEDCVTYWRMALARFAGGLAGEEDEANIDEEAEEYEGDEEDIDDENDSEDEPGDLWWEYYRKAVDSARKRRYLHVFAKEGCERLTRCMHIQDQQLFAPGQLGHGVQVGAFVEEDAVVFQVLYPGGAVIPRVRQVWEEIIRENIATQSLGLTEKQVVSEERPGGLALVAHPFRHVVSTMGHRLRGESDAGHGPKVIEGQGDAPNYEPLGDGLPPLSIIAEPTVEQRRNMDEIRQLAEEAIDQLVELTDIPVAFETVVIGPSVAQIYAWIPKKTPISRLKRSAEDLAGALAIGSSIRITAAVRSDLPPGVRYGKKGTLIVIEVGLPRELTRPVPLADLVGMPAVRQAKGALPIAIGLTPSGRPVITDLGNAPHLLVAGATGGGKSVFLLSIITQLLLRFRPDELRLYLIDPKQVEFTIFDVLPHLEGKVVWRLPDAVTCINHLIAEMERRHEIFKENGARDLNDYNQLMKRNGKPTLPRIVLIVDEFADLLLQGDEFKEEKAQFENGVTRLSQKARAAGIHLILTTQRPTRQSLPTTIKANLPTRVALKCSQRVESEVILDQSGAELLQGKGDLLFKGPEEPRLIRAQGPYVSSDSIRKLVDWWKGDSDTKSDTENPLTHGIQPKMQLPHPTEIWEKVVWKIQDRIDELIKENKGAKRKGFIAAHKDVVTQMIQEIAPGVPVKATYEWWAAEGLIDGDPSQSFTKPLRMPNGKLVRLMIFPVGDEGDEEMEPDGSND